MSDIGLSRGNETEDASYPQRLRPSKRTSGPRLLCSRGRPFRITSRFGCFDHRLSREVNFVELVL